MARAGDMHGFLDYREVREPYSSVLIKALPAPTCHRLSDLTAAFNKNNK